MSCSYRVSWWLQISILHLLLLCVVTNFWIVFVCLFIQKNSLVPEFFPADYCSLQDSGQLQKEEGYTEPSQLLQILSLSQARISVNAYVCVLQLHLLLKGNILGAPHLCPTLLKPSLFNTLPPTKRKKSQKKVLCSWRFSRACQIQNIHPGSHLQQWRWVKCNLWRREKNNLLCLSSSTKITTILHFIVTEHNICSIGEKVSKQISYSVFWPVLLLGIRPPKIPYGL